MGAHPEIDTSTLDHIRRLAQNQADLSRAVSHGQPALRDPAGNILALDPASSTPLLAAQGHDVALNMQGGTVRVTDETGQALRPVAAQAVTVEDSVTAPVFFGDVGVSGSNFNGNGTWWGSLNGDSYGMHHGDVGYNGDQFNFNGHTWGTHHGNVIPQVQGPVGPAGPVGPKGFVIKHPTDTKRWLVHACTEAPHNGVEYWGTAALIDGVADIELPPYFEDLTEHENRSVHLTAVTPLDRAAHQARGTVTTPILSATYPTEGCFRIHAEGPGNIDVWWLVKAVRKDLPALLVEPRRSEVTVSGFGPYRTYSPVGNEDDAHRWPPTGTADQTAGIVRVLWTALGIEQARVDSLTEVVGKLVARHNNETSRGAESD
jgi:hypothetical protein